MGVITRQDMLKAMRTGEPFFIRYCTADRKRNTGGEMREHKFATLAGAKPGTPKGGNKVPMARGNEKDPNHKVHHTINIKVGDAVKKVHVALITNFNKLKPV